MAELIHSPLMLFIAQASAIILLSRLCGFLARRLGQPMVIAEIAAGILLGPSLLGWLLPDVSAVLFPKSSLTLLHMFSQVGLMLFMFLIGLELDPEHMRGRGPASLAISQAGIVVPFGLGLALALYLHPRVSDPEKVPFSSFGLFMGTAMSITAFPVLARILSELRLLKSKVGAAAITCAAFDDVAAWCILAVMSSVVRAHGVRAALQPTLYTVVYVALMLLVGRPFMKRFGARGSNREGLTQNMVAATFLLLMASCWVTELIRIHALFGAFMLGVIVPKTGGFAATLADKLEDFAVVFLLPMFFAYSGLRTQIGLLNSASAWVLCALIVFVACLGKFGGITLAARLSGLNWRESSALGVLMNTRGLMELVVLNIGLDLGVISPALFTMMVIMALVTTFMATPLLHVVYPPAELARELAEPEAPAAAASDAYCVLLCVSYTGAGPGMVTLAEALVRAQPASRIYALKLVRPTERSSYYLSGAQEREGPEDMRAVLSPVIQAARARQLAVRPITFVSTTPGEDICNVAEVKGADLVLLGWHRPLLNRAALGGTVNEVLQEARASVGVLVDRGLVEVRRVLVPFHGTAHDRSALRLAQRLLEHAGVEITVLHVTRPGRSETESREGVRAQVVDVFQEAGPRAAPGEPAPASQVTVKVVAHTNPARAALDEIASARYDLVVIGIGAEWGLAQRQFGINQEYLIRQSPTSLLILREYDPQVQGSRLPRDRRAAEDAVPSAQST